MKAEFKGTPGPWGCTPIDSRETNSNRGFLIHGPVTTRSVRDVIPSEIEPNAKLISAAPELLEALKDAQQLIEYLINAIPTGKVRNTATDCNIICLSAINKALGI